VREPDGLILFNIFHKKRGLWPLQGVEKVDILPERAKKDKSKATGKPVIEAYIRYVD
jgi:hypothetical protein